MAKTDNPKDKLLEFLNSKNYFTDALALIESTTGVNRLYLFGGCVAFLSLYLVVGYASSFLVAVLGFLYPCYASVKAIESDNKGDDTQWLTYWVVYSAFGIVEFFSDIFLSWFPLYFLFKCVFLCWCMAPYNWNGSELIFNKFISPFVKEHEKEAEKLIAGAKSVVQGFAEKAESEVKKVVLEQALAGGKSEDDKKEDDKKKEDQEEEKEEEDKKEEDKIEKTEEDKKEE